jgi:tetratricopeptide (TPR) repeat protein
MLKVSFKRTYKIITIVAVVCLLIGAAAYLYLSHKNKPGSGTQKLGSSETAKVSTLATKDSCEKNQDSVNGINAGALTAEDSARLLNYRGNCYMQQGEYKKALQAFQQLVDSCNKANNQRCAAIAQEQVDGAKDALEHPPQASSSGAKKQ